MSRHASSFQFHATSNSLLRGFEPNRPPSGMLEILRHRAAARRVLGPRFDIRQFHDRVLENGTVTLPMLRELIDQWIGDTLPKGRTK